MRKQFFVPLIILITALTMATGALAQQRDDNRRRRGGKMMKDLNLTDAQQQQIRALRRQQRRHISPLRAQMNRVRAQLKMLWMADTMDVAAIKGKSAEMAALRSRMESLRLDFRLAVGGLLTKEQRIKFASRMGKRNRRGRMNRRGGGHQNREMRGGGNHRGGAADAPLEGAR